jgi:hypothetical protein
LRRLYKKILRRKTKKYNLKLIYNLIKIYILKTEKIKKYRKTLLPNTLFLN